MSKHAARPCGRPSRYSPALADEICERLANGESLRAICAMEGMPCKTTVLRWADSVPAFAEAYTGARALQQRVLAVHTEYLRERMRSSLVALGPAKVRLQDHLRRVGQMAPKRFTVPL